mgnify:FL=1
MSISFESREVWATKCAQHWQTSAQFWTRYGQRSERYHAQIRHADYLQELLHHRSHQPEF